MYNVFNNTTIMIVGIIEIGSGLVALEEFRSALDEATAVSDFCNEYTPVLNTSDYLGVNADSVDLQKSWGWDDSDSSLKEITWMVDIPVLVSLDVSRDYYQFRDYKKNEIASIDWNLLSDKDKDLMIILALDNASIDEATNNANKVSHLMSTGQAANVEDASSMLVNSWASHHVRMVESCKQRAEALRMFVEIGTYLSKQDGQDFFETIQLMYDGFREQAIRGSQDGSDVALFDYIEGTTGTVNEFINLDTKGYTMRNGDIDASNLIIAIMNILRLGQY
jgi:hypothetical protein